MYCLQHSSRELKCQCIHVQNFWLEVRSWWKNYTGKDFKVTLKNILMGFNNRLDQQNIYCICDLLHAKLVIRKKTRISGKPEFCKLNYTEMFKICRESN